MKKIQKKLMVCLLMSLLAALMISGSVFAAASGDTGSKTTKKYGPVKVNDKWYVYDKKGKKAAGKDKQGYFALSQDGVIYYLTDKKVMIGRRKNDTYYHANGKKMDAADTYSFKVELKARKIAYKITDSSMTLAQKKRKCFDWVMNKNYRQYRTFKNTKGWPAVYANDHFRTGFGDCHSDAAAFGYLCKAIGYKEVYCCTDAASSACHSWAEINGFVYDPLFAQVAANGGFSKNYGVKYRAQGGPYKLIAILHVKL